MLHAKTMVIDGDWSFVGSAKVEMRSFRLNSGVGALVLDSESASQLAAKFH